MDRTLPLHPLHALLPLDEPFTPAMARAVGISSRALSRMLSAGLVRRVLRGVYVASTASPSASLRGSSVGLLLGPRDIVVDRTAAWVHGALQPDPVPVDVLARGSLGGRRRLLGRDLVTVGGIRVTSPLRTALDLGRLLPPGAALGVLDALAGSFSQVELLAELPRFAGQRGIAQLRTLAAQVDSRSTCSAESVLRLHWNAANLPTPVPGRLVVAGSRLVRLSLAVDQRQFGVVLASQVSAADLLALEGAGWWVVVLPEERVLSADPTIWTRHLEREFHQHLLHQVRDEEEFG
ncbi:type IV toxin-antitoxin system AbiEi family antitoxin domain-containing protein [Marmoricola sp. URHB0036]|uniref:type IV toxin-antitoxin system AbiEi family antitoxin domain-containing protein n=1 Tax=Marmoricola sp. URHB0036 TaxID=1298863 RepID=UPI0003F5734F|nr:type IV toxin-antitoxin system AbiEi family antitoxin domain-containing protein [Marmoricola sp. URHB0036]